MSVVVYKDGASQKIDPIHLQQHLDIGWRLNEHEDNAEPEAIAEPTPEAVPVSEPEPEPEPEAPPKEAETDPGVSPEDLTNDQIRVMAQQAGITNWDKAQIKTLKQKLGLQKNE